jgi:DNA uptake protein ComE-like DNA-binding protein
VWGKDKISRFKYSKQQRSGIFFLLLIIVVFQVGYFVLGRSSFGDTKNPVTVDLELQAKIDSLKNLASQQDSIKIYPFNPNFITDYKGYVLGMSVAEIDRLLAFRKQNNYVDSPEGFQKVTGVSDSLLDVISPYFKFPEWTKVSRWSSVGSGQYSVGSKQFSVGSGQSPVGRGQFSGKSTWEGLGEIKDLNTVSAEELKSINGIGEKLSARIVKFRDKLGGFLIDAQLYDVYGLSPEVAKRTLKRYRVLDPPQITKININTASAAELAKLVYIPYQVGQRIVEYRTKVGTISSYSELTLIEEFPSDKIDRIKLYLAL